jgi:hypothetical protein
MLTVTDNLVNPKKFRAVFFDIKQKTDELLSAYNNVDFLKNPAVDVDTIAKKNDIIDIVRVPKIDIPERHATYEDGVIKLNEEDSPVEQRFSTGHELDHHIKQKADEMKKANERKQIILSFENMEVKVYLDKQSKKQVESVVKEAAARSNYEWLIQELKKFEYLTKIAKPIAENASKNFGKPIPEDKVYNSIAKLIYKKGIVKLDNNFIFKAADDLYNEEIADYFSANLLVPLERFVLWEDRSDDEIAAAFQVPVECIIKRRKEATIELEFLAE